ncbi:hypothetical protein F8N00_13180 [Exiguobacterium sp. A1_3_1]|uniref:hypothetical protein n=1 Tax=Exiguobacterium sp. A1_3_1 TaxID=2651871 RepID=UPI003B84C5B0
MEKTIEISIQDNILNVYSNITMNEILKNMIKLDEDSFLNRHNDEVEQLKKTRFKEKNNITESVFFVIDNKYYTPGTKADNYIKILRNEFFNQGVEYIDYFENQYLKNLEYHFNVRRVYGMDYSLEGYKDLNGYIDDVYSLLIKKYNPKNLGEYVPQKITDIKEKDDNFHKICKKNNKIEIYEKIGIIYSSENYLTKSVFIRYSFDFENNFFELAYNDRTLKDVCSSTNDRKKVLLESKDKTVKITDKFSNEGIASVTLYERIKELVESKLRLHSLGEQLSLMTMNNTKAEKNESSEGEKLQVLNTEIEAYLKSPFELAMYKIFKEDRDNLISKILGENEEKDTSDIELFIEDKFKDFDNDSISMSVKFLKHMKAFSILKKKAMIVRDLDNFIFSFTVRDWAVTKSTTRNQERLPVYTSDFYWHLQEVVDSIKLINELGLHISTSVSNGKKFYQEVKITLSNDHLIFVYYQNKRRANNSGVKSTLTVSEARRTVNDYVKNKFRSIISEKSES